MIFQLEKTSVWGNKPPSEKATKCTKQHEMDVVVGKDENGNKWYKKRPVAITFYTIEINTIEELLDFMSKEGEDLIIKNARRPDSSYPEYAIEIYDTYRE